VELTNKEKRSIIEDKLKQVEAGIFSLTIDAQAAEIAGNPKGKERVEQNLASAMKTKAALAQLLEKYPAE
jgi:hypothetical protein